jgi:hypothetical protein
VGSTLGWSALDDSRSGTIFVISTPGTKGILLLIEGKNHWGLNVPVVHGTIEHWLGRAREARDIAAQLDDPVARQAMLAVADSYEIVARRAEARAAGVDLPNYPLKSR